MNKNISLLLLSIAMLLMVPFAAFGIGFPHDDTQAVGCANCHTATSSFSANSFVNMCTSCHQPVSANPYVRSAFYQTDAANPYNRLINYSSNTTTPPGKVKYTSHNWAGSEVAPEAGAKRPTIVKMNTTTLGTTLSCARCHNIHGARAGFANSAPFLRSKNANDEMCRDCHRDRDVTTHTSGSHPVNIRYTSATSKVVTSPSDYYFPTRNANPSNPTSAMKMVNGKVMCSTCHGVHYTDSNSGTTDNKESWANLSSSRGMLLRTDTFGKTDAESSVNICTGCHNKPNHQVYADSKTNAKPIQCVDCHTGHVEYIKPEDKALGGENAIFNVYLLRRYMNYSGGVKLDSYRRKAFLTSTSSTATLRNASGTAICQACHNLPSNVSEHSTTSTKNQCILCHGGSLHSKVAPVGCTGCHGSPPEHTVAGTITYGTTPSKGYAVYSSRLGVPQKSYQLPAGIYKNESTAGHPTHAAGKPYSFACSQCHNGYDHYKQSYQDVFKSPGALSPAASFTAGGASSTCSNMYCHSYGKASLTGAKTVEWKENIRGSFEAGGARCVQCHNGAISSLYNNLSTNSHFQHVNFDGKKITCNICHASTASSSTAIASYTKHVNNSREVSFSGLAAGSVYNGSTCTSACHTNGASGPPLVTPIWSDRNTGKCNSCHRTATTPSGIISTGAHFTHISSNYGPKLNTNNLCSSCHNYASETAITHVDGAISKNTGAAWCANCHGGAEPTSPAWTGSGRLSCQSCHSGRANGTTDTPASRSWSKYDGTGVQAPFKGYTTFTNRGHGKGATYNTCQSCHNENSGHISGVLGDSNRLLSGLGTGNTNIACHYCHNDASKVTNSAFRGMSSHVSARYATNQTLSLCSACHDPHGSKNEAMIKYTFNVLTGNGRGAAVKTVTFTNPTSGFVNSSRTGICQVCHTNTKVYRNYTSSTGIYAGSVTFSGSWGHVGGNKRCMTCHKHSATGFAFKVSGGGACDGCHGYPPATNAHQSHITIASAKPASDAYIGTSNNTMSCAACHFNGTQSTFDGSHMTGTPKGSIDVQDSYKFNSAGTLDNSNYDVSFSCSNVSCHFKASPTWK